MRLFLLVVRCGQDNRYWKFNFVILRKGAGQAITDYAGLDPPVPFLATAELKKYSPYLSIFFQLNKKNQVLIL